MSSMRQDRISVDEARLRPTCAATDETGSFPCRPR